MKRFIDLKISSKLVIGFLIIAMLAAVIGAVGLLSLLNLWKEDKQLYEENTLALQHAGSASTTFVLIRYNTYKLSVLEDPGKLQEVSGDSVMLLERLDDYLQKCGAALVNKELKETFQKLEDEWINSYKPDMEKIMQLSAAGDRAGAQALVPGLAALGTDMYNEFVSFLAMLSEDAATKADVNSRVAQTSILVIAVVTALGVTVAVILALVIAGIISKPLNRAVQSADRLAVGDLDAGLEMDAGREDEVGKLADAFDKLIASTRKQVAAAKRIADGDLTVQVETRSEKDQLGQGLSELVHGLRDMVSSIYAAADQVATGSTMLSDSSMALSQGATEQASVVEELTAAIEEISAQTAANANSAEEANALANSSKVNAEEGDALMKSMLDAMDEISESSKSISRIIKVIEDIAFQTNILALNAAVEAARAGQHGKGFAVVAEEVRTLASKSANAAKETTDMIEGSIRKVEAGTKLAAQTADALSRIVGQIERAAALNSAIAEASKEQSMGIEQINTGIVQVSQVVQTNAATSEESAAASEELSGQAEHLKDIVSVFKLSDIPAKKKKEKKSAVQIDLGAEGGFRQRLTAGETDFGKY